MNWIARLTLLGSLASCAPSSDSGFMDAGDTGDTGVIAIEADRASAERRAQPATRVPSPAPSSRGPLPTSPSAAPAVVTPAVPAAVAPEVEVTGEEAAPATEDIEITSVTTAPVQRCEVFEGEGCFWMENTSGNYCWVPWNGTDLDQCKRLDSCDGGDGWSGGGCYKWSDGSSGARAPWPASPAPEQDVFEGLTPEGAGEEEMMLDEEHEYGC